MNKTIFSNERIGEKYICARHKSGLTVLLYPMQGYSSACAMLGTHYGSVDRTFKTNHDSDYITVPDGIAHYLEHKLFESEDGDAFSLFAQTGASANAYTSFERTAYYFSCTENFEQSLETLLKFVQSPYFTDETVQKEQGIIGQEISMYDDDPSWQVLFHCLGNLFHHHPVKIDIAGTQESIAKIDKDLLYRCYHTFYNMNNMVLVVAGCFDVDSTLSIVENNIKDIEPLTIERADIEEPKEVVCSRSDVKLSVSQPQFCIGYKLAPLDGLERLVAEVECRAVCELLTGEASPLYRELYETGLVAGGNVSAEVFAGHGYFAVLFEGESKDPDKVYELLKRHVDRLRDRGIAENEFELVKKALYGNVVASYNTVDRAANQLLGSALSGASFFDEIDITAKLNLSDVQKRLAAFDNRYSTLSIVSPCA